MRLLCMSVLLGLGLVAASAEPVEWQSDLAKAETKAKDESKRIYLLFTGSNWCPACMMLERNVHRDREFLRYVEEKLVLLKADFPRPNRLPAAQQMANEKLAVKFGIEYFPTVVVLDGAGKELGRLSYQGGDGAAWVQQLERIGKKG